MTGFLALHGVKLALSLIYHSFYCLCCLVSEAVMLRSECKQCHNGILDYLCVAPLSDLFYCGSGLTSAWAECEVLATIFLPNSFDMVWESDREFMNDITTVFFFF